MPERNEQPRGRIRFTTTCFNTFPVAAAESILRRPARLGLAQRQRLKPPPATGNRLKPVGMIAGGRKTGSTVLTTYSSSGTRQSERAYYAFGDDRRTVNTPLTDHLFTGQKQDESGLYYYNARYYDPEIGHFISPDTLVPDPMRVDAYNRYMYALGNPLKYNDPSGHIAVCFKGGVGDSSEEAPIEGFLQNCRQSLLDGGYDESVHGKIWTLYNGEGAIQRGYDEILLAMENNPDQPVIIAGYSWGGGAALELAYRLSGSLSSGNDSPEIGVDLLFLVDAEQDMRGPIPRAIARNQLGDDGNVRRVHTRIRGNVTRTVNMFAEDAGDAPWFTIGPLTVNYPGWSPQNGINTIRGQGDISNTGVAADHLSIVREENRAATFGALVIEVDKVVGP